MRAPLITLAFLASLCGCRRPDEAACDRGELARCQQACDAKKLAACRKLGDLYAGGQRGLPLDKARAAELYERACAPGAERGRPACERLGHMYLTGDGVPKNPREAARYFDRACQVGNREACDRAAEIMKTPRE